jgi:hypothetical protein
MKSEDQEKRGFLSRLFRRGKSAEGTHDDDRLPTSMSVPGAAAGGVWNPRRHSSLVDDGAPGHISYDDPLKPNVK